MYKKCSKCKRLLSIKNFTKKSSSKDGLDWWCKKCNNKYKKEYKEKNREKVNKRKRLWRQKNKDRVNEEKRKQYPKNRDAILYRRRNKTEEEKVEIREKNKLWRKNNKEKYNLSYNKWQKEKYHNDHKFKMICNLRSSLYQFLKNTKTKSSNEYGIDFKKIIDRLGPPPNQNSSIDHIMPCSLFDHTNYFHIWMCWHPDNFQWLGISDNIRKNNYCDKNRFLNYINKKSKEYKNKGKK
jgi:hypothetical protein